MRNWSGTRRGLLAVFAVVMSACADTAPMEPEQEQALLWWNPNPSRTLIECPTSETKSITGIIDNLGGLLQLDGHQVSIPLGAVLFPTEFTLTVPASRYMEVHITANGEHGFSFLNTALITISYARCNRSLIAKPLVAYKIDPDTKALLKNMGGLQNILLRTVTFVTDSLSGYSLAE